MRRNVALLAVGVLVLTVIQDRPVTTATATTRPNVVFIIADDLSFELMDRLPNVQALLVDKGESFTNMFAVDPLCCPSRTSFLRGQYSHTTGEYNVQYEWGGWSHVHTSGLENQTLPVWMRDAGYYTAEQGKYLNGYNKATYTPPGWLNWKAMMRVGYEPGSWNASVNGRTQEPAEYAPDWVSDQAVGAIQASGTQPLFMWTAYFDPHVPTVPPARYDTLEKARPCEGVDVQSIPGFDEKATDLIDGTKDKPRWISKRAVYSPTHIATLQDDYQRQCEASLAIDDGVGRIVAALEVKDPGLLNTIIVFTSDQGLQNGAHMQVAKKVPWDESAKLPFVVRDDAALGGSPSTNDSLLGNIDFAPTVLELTGATGSPGCGTDSSIYRFTCMGRGGGFDGFSFAPLILGTPYEPRQSILIEHWDPAAITEKVPTYCAVRSKTEMLVRYWADDDSGADWEGYDLTTDPNELHSLVYSNLGASATSVPLFRPGGQQVYDDMFGSLVHLCFPEPPEYPGF